MSERDLDQLLRALRDELARTDFADERTRELATNLLRETDELARVRAAGAPPPAAPPATLRGRLEAAVTRFEATHPALSETMSRLLNALADAGL